MSGCDPLGSDGEGAISAGTTGGGLAAGALAIFGPEGVSDAAACDNLLAPASLSKASVDGLSKLFESPELASTDITTKYYLLYKRIIF